MLKSKYEPGFYPNLSNEDYHADPAISSSGMKLFCEIPDLYYRTYLADNRLERDTTSGMRDGSSAHVFLLEPDKFDQYFEVAPEKFINETSGKECTLTRSHKKKWGELNEKAVAEGKTLLLKKEYDTLPDKTHTLMEDEFVYSVFSTPGYIEASFFANDPETGLPLRAKPDKLVEIPDKGIFIIDYKTTGAALDDDKQDRQAQDQMRQLQGTLHKQVVELVLGQEINGVIYITQHTKPPYYVRTFQLPEDWIEDGSRLIEIALMRMAECFEKGHFPGYPKGIQYYGELKPWHRDVLPMGLRPEIYQYF